MSELTCPICDEPFQPGDVLCMSCGANLARVGGVRRHSTAGEQQPAPQPGYGPQPSHQAPPQPQYGQHQQPPGLPGQEMWGPSPQPGRPEPPAENWRSPQQPAHDWGQGTSAQGQGPGGDWPPAQHSPQHPPQSQDWGAPALGQGGPSAGQDWAPAQGGGPAWPSDQGAQGTAGGGQNWSPAQHQAPPPHQQPPYPGVPHGPADHQTPPPQHGGRSFTPPPHGREATLLPPDESAGQRGPASDSTAFMCPHCEAVLSNPAAVQCDNCLRPIRQRTPVLRVIFPSGEVKVSVGQHLVLGRDAGQSPVASTFIQYDNVSRRHSTLWLDPSGAAWVRDEGSTNGTFVNGERLPRGVEAPLHDGDQLRLAADVTGTVQLT